MSVTFYSNPEPDRRQCDINSIENQFERAFKDRKVNAEAKELCITWYRPANSFCWYSKLQLNEQMKLWRKLSKEGKLKIMAYNNQETEQYGKKIYYFVIQSYNNEKMTENGMCPFSMNILERLVDGYTYCFTRRENRDSIYNYVMKDITQTIE